MRSNIREIIAYLFFGFLTTVVNVAVYASLARGFGVDYLASNVVAWVVSVAFAYVTNKLWVFGSRDARPKTLLYEAGAFFTSRVASGLADTLLMYLLVSVAAVDDLAAKVAVNIVVIVMNYVLSKFFVFRDASSRGVARRC